MQQRLSSPCKSSKPVDTVRVAVRVRPLNQREQQQIAESRLSWSINDSSITQQVNGKPIPTNIYSFDNVFVKSSTNQQIFDTVAKTLVSSTIDGINGVIFAYGQTAAGKTYTMLGTEQDPGITRRSISHVFNQIATVPNRQFLLRASYIEIYNEVIRDLLVPSNDNLKIHEDVINKRVFVDCREEVVTDVNQVMQIIKAGEMVRAVGETNMNERSSRSHTIFSLKIESREINQNEPDTDNESLSDGDDGIAVKSSTLSLVDLAGSERASFTKAQGMRLVEGGHINKSLLTLGTVINKLSSGETKSTSHIPYRDSKLTRLLQPALGGNARTAIICAMTPAILHMEETLSTLKFATRAKKVTNKAQTNEFLDDRAKLRRAEKQIAALMKECNRLKLVTSSGLPSSSTSSSSPGILTRDSFNGELLRKREQNFERKFELLLDALKSNSQNDLQSRYLTPNKSRRQTISRIGKTSNLTAALNLNLSLKDASSSTNCNEHEDQAVHDLRRKLFQAEKDKRKAIKDIEFERYATKEEIQLLEAAADESHRMRMYAEQESEEAVNALARAQVASLVDEIVSESMATASLTNDLREAKRKLEEMERVGELNEEMKNRVSTLERENSDFVKREKRGIGPYLKQVKALQTKLTEVESKFKTARQNNSKMSSEKTVLEREIKDRERKIKTQNTELEKRRNHSQKTKERINKEIAEEKKKHDQDTKHLREEIGVLVEKVEGLEKQLKEQHLRMKELQRETEESKRESIEAREYLKGKDVEMRGLKQLVHDLRENENNYVLQIEQLEERERLALDQNVNAAEELRLAQIQIEDIKGELSKVYESKRNQEDEEIDQLRRLVNELRITNEESESMFQNESKKVDELRAECNIKEDTIEKLKNECESLEVELKKRRDMEKDLKNQLKNIESEKVMPLLSLRTELSHIRDELSEEQWKNEDLGKQVEIIKNENNKIREENDSMYEECTIRLKELHRLTSIIKHRDERIYKLEEELDKIFHGGGRIAKLEERIHRRNIKIEELNRQIHTQEDILEKNGLSEELQSVQRIFAIESENHALKEESKQKDYKICELESERTKIKEEAKRLRDRIKERDIERISDEVKKREQVQQMKR